MECTITRLLKDGDNIAGAFGYWRESGRFVVFEASTVVLATGGITNAAIAGQEQSRPKPVYPPIATKAYTVGALRIALRSDTGTARRWGLTRGAELRASPALRWTASSQFALQYSLRARK